MRTVQPLEPPAVPRLLRLRTMELEGRTPADVARAAKAGRLHRVIRGTYVEEPTSDAASRLVARAYASAPRLLSGMVFSHTTAATLHGLTRDERIVGTALHISRPGADGGWSRGDREVHATRLGPDDVTADPLPMTALARTVVDCARTLPFDQAVTVADRALRSDRRPEEIRLAMARVAERLRGCKGIERARRVIAFADPGAANGGESAVRVALHVLGLPAPIVQYRVTDPSDPYFEAFADLGWPDMRTVLEFDGVVKYRAGNPSGRAGHEVLVAEKRREDRLRALGWQVVRVVWADLRRPDRIAAQLRQAFARGTRWPRLQG